MSRSPLVNSWERRNSQNTRTEEEKRRFPGKDEEGERRREWLLNLREWLLLPERQGGYNVDVV